MILTEDEQSFRGSVQSWLEATVPPLDAHDAPVVGHIHEVNSAAEIDAVREWNRMKWEAGWAGITWPTQYGGQAKSIMHEIVWKQECIRFKTWDEACVVGPSLAGPVILHHGVPEQRAFYLPSILSGEHIWCQLFSEPEAGSDLAGLRATATLDGDHYVVNGHKIWSSVAQYADFGLLLARTNTDAPKHRGISCFALDMTSDGIRVEPIRQMNGQQTFNEVFLENVRVPASNIIGDVDNGWRVAMDTLSTERLYLGLRRGVNIPRLVELALGSGGTGELAAGDPLLRTRLVDLFVRDQALQSLGLRAIELAMQGASAGPHGSIAKLLGAQMMNEAADLALDMQGPQGLVTGPAAPQAGAWQDGFLSSPARRIGGGTDEIQRNIIAEHHLGMPRERRPS